MSNDYENPFSQLNTDLRDVPPDMRKRVMNDIAIAKLILDMATLLTSNYSALLKGLLKTSKKNN